MVGRNFFRLVSRRFGKVVKRHAGKPTTYVEIGCWHGGSAAYVAEHVLSTHVDSVGYGIDPYGHNRKHDPDKIEEIRLEAHAVVAATGFQNWNWIRKPSIEALSNWVPLTGGQEIDCLYIDGRHEAFCAVLDFALAWPWLKPGATVIFDDYGIGTRKHFPHVPEAVDAIEHTFGNLLTPLTEYAHKDRQAYYEVRAKDVDSAWWSGDSVISDEYYAH